MKDVNVMSRRHKIFRCAAFLLACAGVVASTGAWAQQTTPGITFSLGAPEYIVDEKVGAVHARVFALTHTDQRPSIRMSVRFSTSDGSAVQGSDYEATSVLLTFDPSDFVRPSQLNLDRALGNNFYMAVEPVSVRVVDDAVDEPDETFNLHMDVMGLNSGFLNEVYLFNEREIQHVTRATVPVTISADGVMEIETGATMATLTWTGSIRRAARERVLRLGDNGYQWRSYRGIFPAVDCSD